MTSWSDGWRTGRGRSGTGPRRWPAGVVIPDAAAEVDETTRRRLSDLPPWVFHQTAIETCNVSVRAAERISVYVTVGELSTMGWSGPPYILSSAVLIPPPCKSLIFHGKKPRTHTSWAVWPHVLGGKTHVLGGSHTLQIARLCEKLHPVPGSDMRNGKLFTCRSRDHLPIDPSPSTVTKATRSTPTT
jgi:hypothetical protein